MENGERENKMKWRIENRKSFFFVVLYLFEIYFLMKRNRYFSSIPTFSFKVVEGQNLRNENI